MIWINISNILHENKFTGIVRTEYELCYYAYQSYVNNHNIGFCTFDNCLGFIKLDYQYVLDTLNRLKNAQSIVNKKLNRQQKLKISTLKRLHSLRIMLGNVKHCFNQGDTIICVGQKLGNQEMKSLRIIKKQINLQFRLLCHDLIPINYPQFFFSKNTHLFLQYINEAIHVIDYAYCNSEFTKQELLEFYKKSNISPPPMSVVTLGCDLYTKTHSGEIKDKLKNIINQPFVLFVSTIEIRKNHQLIYHMYLKLIEENHQNLPLMCFVGRRGWKVDDLLDLLNHDERIKDKIIILDDISDSDLVLLYKKCWFTVYPSLIEGYGLPVAESLSFGKYCLASNAGSLPEAGGTFIDYISPKDLNAWADKFLFLINHPDYIKNKEQTIKQNYQPISWENFAKQILDNEINNKTITS